MASRISIENFSNSEIPNYKKYMTVKEVAFRTGVSPKTIYKWVYCGYLQPDYIGPKNLRFQSSYIEYWLIQQQHEPLSTRFH